MTTTSLTLSDPSLLREACFIDGEWITGADTLDVIDPARGTLVARVPRLGAAETEAAVIAAERALPAWRALTADERSRLLMKLHDLLIDNVEDLARLLTAEQGKPLAESRGEIRYGAGYLRWFAEEARRIYGETIPAHAADKRLIAIRQPVGVVGAITPWNFPNAMIARKLAPALAAGCTMVLKPAELTPLSAFALAELARRAGIPRGVFNVLTGDAAAIGGVLTKHPAVRKITFTGSTAVGKLLLAQAADTVKKVSMELGGHAPFIVFDDADLDAAVEGAVAAKYRNSGQTCVCANRFIVQAGIHDAFVEKLGARAAALKVGPGDAEGTVQGPLIDARAVAKVESHVADAIGQGARVVTGGRRHEAGANFYAPTVLAGVTPAMRIAREETFGPVAPVFRFETEAEALALANASESGLAGYFFTRDIGRAFRVAEAMEVGMVGINTGLISTEVAPFGGVKQSGLGREGGRAGIEDYLEIKYLCFGGI
ncbi:NAD-dependent succinate-semialdehyde dehydrogenase [Derxia gummosa]|uniref:NAD-dependent succinate-semialdehyde dehydrogenase n=1 Tax=Derxia gummosa DSM 723 TaxID=1121388 RepID=A0A8B6X777_9BURK|nr:NAD-dependent succinate-semialdehyde dehydrogenase [Derxia gummosa]